MRRQSPDGFSLIELLIVVTILGIIASIAIPNLLASRRAANEGPATQSMRTLSSCENTYKFTYGNGNYTDLTTLGAKVMTDQVLSTGTKSGYTFVATPEPGPPQRYWAYGYPLVTSGITQTGTRRFGISDDGVLRADNNLAAPPANMAAEQAMPPLNN